MTFDYDAVLDGAQLLWDELAAKPLAKAGSSYAAQMRSEEFYDLMKAIRSAQMARGRQRTPAGRIGVAYGLDDPLLARGRRERAGFDPRKLGAATEKLLVVLEGRSDAASLKALRKVLALQALVQAAVDHDDRLDAEADEIPPPCIVIAGRLPTETAEEAEAARRAETLAMREEERLQAEKFVELTREFGEDVKAARDAFAAWIEERRIQTS